MKLMERIFIIGMMIFSGLVIYEGIKLPIKSEYTIGPGFLPIVIGIGIFISSISCIVQSVYKYKKLDTDTKFISKEGATRLGIFIAVLTGALLLNEIFGLLISMVVFMIVILRYVEKYSWFVSIRVAIISNIIFYLIFEIWLRVPLPGINL